MYQQKTVKIFALVAIVLSAIGLLFSIFGIFSSTNAGFSFSFFLGMISWALLLWASIVGHQLCISYNLYEDEYKKVGIRIYLIIAAFFLFFFVGVFVGIILSGALLATLLGLKLNYDEWEHRPLPDTQVVDDTTESTNSNEATNG